MKTVDFIARFEGFRAQAYWDASRWSIGYGTKANGPNDVILYEKARATLEAKVARYFSRIKNLRDSSVSCGKLVAMTSLSYNIGYYRWLRNFGELWEQGHDTEVSQRILLFRKANGKVLRGLESRRKAEAELYKK